MILLHKSVCYLIVNEGRRLSNEGILRGKEKRLQCEL